MTATATAKTNESSLANSTEQPDGRTIRRDDETLQACRRLDWQFLLPRPELDRVLYWGAAGTSLQRALERFAASVTTKETIIDQDHSDDRDQFDLAVAIAPTRQCLDRIDEMLAPGGCLYFELNSNRTPQPDAETCSADDCANRLTLKGYQHIAIHWHRPNFDRCLEILPIRDAHTMQYYFSRPAGDLQSWLKIFSGRLLMNTGLLERIVPSLSVVAQKGTGGN